MLEQFDGFSPLRNGLRRVAADRSHWAGIPMPLDGQRLVINPKFPDAEKLAKIGAPDEEPLPDNVKPINFWWSNRLRCEVYVYEEDGKRMVAKLPRWNNLNFAIQTLGCSVAWGIEQEARAIDLLGTLVKHNAFKQYLLTGMFLETSSRSNVTYLFRRLRPTVAMKAVGDRMRTLCALCQHPIAYYHDTWAGAMTPTDDVVSHLMLMRADEPMFWKRSNQHSPDRPEAGL